MRRAGTPVRRAGPPPGKLAALRTERMSPGATSPARPTAAGTAARGVKEQR